MAQVTKFYTNAFMVDMLSLKQDAQRAETRRASAMILCKPKIPIGFVTDTDDANVKLRATATIDLLQHTLSISPYKFTHDLRCRVSMLDRNIKHLSWWDDDASGCVSIPLCAVMWNVFSPPPSTLTHQSYRPYYLNCALELSAVNVEKCFVMTRYLGDNAAGCVDCTGNTNFTSALGESVKSIPDNSSKFAGEHFQKDDGTDILITSGDSEFWVHRDVVCGQSDVIKLAFEVDMEENAKKTVDIPNFSSEVLKMFLEILYTRSKMMMIAKDGSALVALYSIAHQYDVHDIVKLTLLALSGVNIESELFHTVIDLAKVHDLQDLMKHCITCAKKYDPSFWDEPAYKDLVSKDPDLAVKLMGFAMNGGIA